MCGTGKKCGRENCSMKNQIEKSSEFVATNIHQTISNQKKQSSSFIQK